MAYYGNYYRPPSLGGFSFFPPVIKWLLIINGAVFVLTNFIGSAAFSAQGEPSWFTAYFALWPLGYGFLPWQVITYQFMHEGFFHLFFNMFFGLWMFGMEIENLWGSRKFLFFYLMCGVVAAIFQLLLGPILEPGRISVVVGASGAVFGVLVAFAMLFPDRYIYLWFLFPVKAKYFIAVLLLLGVLSVGGPTRVANLAHLGGAFAGYVYLLVDRRRLPMRGMFDRIAWWINSMSRPPSSTDKNAAVDAKVVDFQEKQSKAPTSPDEVMQKQVDEILDKISKGGYQSLTEEEKKILFEASKKIH